jgi:polyisoprenoid-binding protein YceI
VAQGWTPRASAPRLAAEQSVGAASSATGFARPASASAAPDSGRELVPDGHWTIDGDHSSVGFVVHHLGITKLRGRFADVTGVFTAQDGALTGTATVAANTVQTGSDARDRHVKGPDFLNVEVNPLVTFTIESVQTLAERFSVEGTLTLNGVTRPITFVGTSGGMAKDPYGHDRVGLSMAATIRRSDFSIVFDPSGALVGNDVAIEIDLSLVRQPDYLRVAEALGRSVSG